MQVLFLYVCDGSSYFTLNFLQVSEGHNKVDPVRPPDSGKEQGNLDSFCIHVNLSFSLFLLIAEDGYLEINTFTF